MYKLLNLILLQALLCLNITGISARQKEVVVPVKEGMVWWCGISNHGELLPMHNGYHANLNSNYGNQVQPLLLSNMGHVIWSEQPFEITMENDTLTVISSTPSLIYTKSGTTLKEGFKYASENYFPPAGKLPDELLFSAPQYNTWIELTYNQNQEDILNYARQVIANGFPPGVLMIDDNWQEDYGKWDFHPGRFLNPKGMMDSLHQMGYNFTCPDMVGGGEYGSFLEGNIIDQDLIVRSAQCHALMPMMQFSVAPWRILDEKHLDACKKAVELRKKYTPLILELAKESAYTGGPIVQSMEYVFPHRGYERVKDQFLLGENVLVAPLLEKGEGIRKVLIPEGKWKNTEGGIIAN